MHHLKTFNYLYSKSKSKIADGPEQSKEAQIPQLVHVLQFEKHGLKGIIAFPNLVICLEIFLTKFTELMFLSNTVAAPEIFSFQPLAGQQGHFVQSTWQQGKLAN